MIPAAVRSPRRLVSTSFAGSATSPKPTVRLRSVLLLEAHVESVQFCLVLQGLLSQHVCPLNFQGLVPSREIAPSCTNYIISATDLTRTPLQFCTERRVPALQPLAKCLSVLLQGSTTLCAHGVSRAFLEPQAPHPSTSTRGRSSTEPRPGFSYSSAAGPHSNY